MAVKLTINPPRDTSSRVVEFDEDCVTIGRSSRSDIRLPFRTVSGIHLTIYHDSSRGYLVRDEESTNGTLLDGEPMKSSRDYPLTSGTVLEIVDLRMEVDLVPTLGAGIPLEKTGTMVRQMVGEALLGGAASDGDERAYFEVLEGRSSGERFELPDDLEEGSIASDPQATVCLDELSTCLEIYRDGDGFGVRPADGAAQDGEVLVNDTPLRGERHLTAGDVIDMGDVRLRYFDPLESYLAELDGVVSGASQTTNGDLGAPSSLAEDDQSNGRDDAGDQQAAPALSAGDKAADGGQEVMRAESETVTGERKTEPPSTKSREAGLGVVEIVLVLVSLTMLVGVAYLFALIFELI